jgi:hypothetical protein
MMWLTLGGLFGNCDGSLLIAVHRQHECLQGRHLAGVYSINCLNAEVVEVVPLFLWPISGAAFVIDKVTWVYLIQQHIDHIV